MPRKQREKSGTGIYHVMMRGINHQDIFEDRGDYWKFLKLLRMQTHPEDKQGHPLPAHLIVYAYCLMSNHVHLLIQTSNLKPLYVHVHLALSSEQRQCSWP